MGQGRYEKTATNVQLIAVFSFQQAKKLMPLLKSVNIPVAENHSSCTYLNGTNLVASTPQAGHCLGGASPSFL